MTAPHDRPTAQELVTAVREFLEKDVMTATEGRVQFHTRIAVNVLGMVERELEVSEVEAAAHADRLAKLGVKDDRELVDAIRAGHFDDDPSELLDSFAAAVEAKLSVANPGYREHKRP